MKTFATFTILAAAAASALASANTKRDGPAVVGMSMERRYLSGESRRLRKRGSTDGGTLADLNTQGVCMPCQDNSNNSY
jgi:hypothetical protein